MSAGRAPTPAEAEELRAEWEALEKRMREVGAVSAADAMWRVEYFLQAGRIEKAPVEEDGFREF